MKSHNGIQNLSVIGIVFSLFVHLVTALIDKKIDNIWALYITWTGVYIFGFLINMYHKNTEHQH